MESTNDDEPSGTEEEDTSATGLPPFDPNKIRVRLWTPTVDLLMKRIKEGEIDLAPEFQRKAGIWKDREQSRLIESLLVRIPLPAFFIDGRNEDCLAVIDGIQRLTSLKRFMLDGELKLQDMQFLPDLNTKTFAELPRSLQRRIEETMVTVNIVEKGTPEGAKLNIFKRINTGGLALSPQEIRHAMNPGKARDFLRDLAESNEFLLATVRSISPDRMIDRECALRFVAFTLTPSVRYPDEEFDTFLSEAMGTLNGMNTDEREALGLRFRRAMRAAYDVLGNKAFRKLSRTGPRGPINKALFEAWSVNLDALTDEQINELVRRRDALISGFIDLLKMNTEFEKAVTQGTGDRGKIVMRFDEIRQLMQRVLT